MFKGFRGFRSDVSEKSTSSNQNSTNALFELEKEAVLNDPESYIDLGKYQIACLEEEVEQGDKLERELTDEERKNAREIVKERCLKTLFASYGLSYNDYLAKKKRVGEKIS